MELPRGNYFAMIKSTGRDGRATIYMVAVGGNFRSPGVSLELRSVRFIQDCNPAVHPKCHKCAVDQAANQKIDG